MCRVHSTHSSMTAGDKNLVSCFSMIHIRFETVVRNCTLGDTLGNRYVQGHS